MIWRKGSHPVGYHDILASSVDRLSVWEPLFMLNDYCILNIYWSFFIQIIHTILFSTSWYVATSREHISKSCVFLSAWELIAEVSILQQADSAILKDPIYNNIYWMIITTTVNGNNLYIMIQLLSPRCQQAMATFLGNNRAIAPLTPVRCKLTIDQSYQWSYTSSWCCKRWLYCTMVWCDMSRVLMIYNHSKLVGNII